MKREGTSDKMLAGHIQMKKRRIAMYSKEDIAYWMDVFERANRAPVSEKEWCRLNHIPYRQYTGKKYRMKKAGYMYGSGGMPCKL